MPMKKILLSSVAVVLCLSAIAQNNADLKLNLEKNIVYRLSSTSEQTILQTVNGNQQTIESKTIDVVSIKMVDAKPTFIVAEVHFDTIASQTNTMGKNVNMTSSSEGNIQSKETSDIMSFFMNKMSKNPLFVKMDFTGKVIEIVNSKMFSDIVMKDTASITLTGPMASGIKTQVKNMVNDNALRTMVEMFTYNLPGKQVSPGDNWSYTVTATPGGMSLDITTSFHLDGISGNKANITAESNIKTAANALPMEAMGAKISYDDLKGLGKSTNVIDISTGLTIESKSKTHISGNMGVSMPGMSMQIPLDITSDSKVVAIK
jgi:hypothetical protein